MNEQFSGEEIKLAGAMKARGLSWEPQVGHFVFDMTRLVKKPSPFQDGVYFVLHYDYFMDLVGGIDRFKQLMIWLPTWEDSRKILRSLGMSDAELMERLVSDAAFENRGERLAAYRLIVVLLGRSSIQSRLAGSHFDANAKQRLNGMLNT